MAEIIDTAAVVLPLLVGPLTIALLLTTRPQRAEPLDATDDAGCQGAIGEGWRR